MKKTIIFLHFVVMSSIAFAQMSSVNEALRLSNSGRLDRAFEIIEVAVDHNNPKSRQTIESPKTWEVRGEIMQAIGASKEPVLKLLIGDPLSEALKSYKKVLELDATGRFTRSMKIKLTLLTNDFVGLAVEGFNSEDYATSLRAFESILDLQSLPVMKEDRPGAIDTIIIFNAGLAAYNAGDLDKAIRYYTEAAKHNYNNERTYQLLALTYLEKGDTTMAMSTIEKGLVKFPRDMGLREQMNDIYIATGRPDYVVQTASTSSHRSSSGELNSYASHIRENYPKEYDETLKKYALLEWREDYSMVVYEINRQAEGIFALINQFVSDNTNIVINAILEWSRDGYYDRNLKILEEIDSINLDNLLRMHCDWTMVEYEYSKQAKAKRAF